MKLLCTLGPATFAENEIKKLTQLEVDLFRINLSHTKAEDLEGIINLIRSHSDVPICLDSEGAQVRTGDFREKSYLIETGSLITIPYEKVLGEKDKFNLYPLNILNQLDVGTVINIDFNSVIATVVKKTDAGIILKLINGGVVGSNKAVTCDKEILMDPLTEKDKLAMAIGKRMGIKRVALSFAHRASDVDEIRKVCADGTKIISKIECLSGLKNLEEIIRSTDEILIDRGDLSREVPVEHVPIWQKKIISLTNDYKKPVYVATNLLESMVNSPLPTRAEVNDIYNTMIDGASGLVLAAETAIGNYPVECVVMIKKIMATYMSSKSGTLDYVGYAPSLDLLPLPHGGKLVQQFTKFEEKYKNLPQIKVSNDSVCDIEQIAHGAFSPLTGFMGEKEILSVLENDKLPSGVPWTLPIILQIDEALKNEIGNFKEVVVVYNNNYHSIIKIKNIFEFNFEEHFDLWFGTSDKNHYGIQSLLKKGRFLIEGDVFLFNENQYQNHQLAYTPKQIRNIFSKLGWSNVVGFHTRNVPHFAHEFIQDEALKKVHSDAMLISPVIGAKKPGDFETDVIFEAYDISLKERNNLKTKFFLSGFNTYSRYTGPREAVFTALCRKNMGCSHFVVGRDHAGVGDYYSPYASQEIFERLGDIGIKPVFFPEIAYNTNLQKYEEKNNTATFESISGTEVRSALQSNKSLPSWFIRDGIGKMIKDKISSGKKVFVE